MQDYLNNVQQYYIKVYNIKGDAEDKLVGQLQKELGADQFMAMKNAYENESLNTLVTNGNSMGKYKILEVDGELIQRSDPVFLDPPANKFLRAHFYAPRKAIFGRYFDTYWVNMTVIWIMTILLIVTLYFDALKKLIDGAGNFFLTLWRKEKGINIHSLKKAGRCFSLFLFSVAHASCQSKEIFLYHFDH